MIQITLNGEQQQTSCRTLFELVTGLNLGNQRYAVEVNQLLVPKSQLAEVVLQADMQIEVVVAVGGG